MNNYYGEYSMLELFAILGGASSFVAIIFSVWKYLSSRKTKIIANSLLKISERDNFIAAIKVLNWSGPPIEIGSIRLDIFSWNQSPKLKVEGILKAQRIIDYLLEREGTWFFPSDVSQTNSSDMMPQYLIPKQSMSIYIDLDRMMEEYFEYGEGGHFENRLFFRLQMRFLKVRIETTDGKLFMLKANREIGHYLYTKYKNDNRIFAYPEARA